MQPLDRTFYGSLKAHYNTECDKWMTMNPGHLIMVALCNRADHYIFVRDFYLSFFFLFFPRLISAAIGWMSTILPHMVWP